MNDRRLVLRVATGSGLALVLPRTSGAQVRARDARPQEGDRFVVAAGDSKGTVVRLPDLQTGSPPLSVLPRDPSGTIRDGSRLNQILMVRLDETRMSAATRTRSAQGVLAYSAVCTHTGCDGLSWAAETLRFRCPCHESEFDAADGARVVGGPAPRRLPALPLKIVDDYVVAAATFSARAGVIQP